MGVNIVEFLRARLGAEGLLAVEHVLALLAAADRFGCHHSAEDIGAGWCPLVRLADDTRLRELAAGYRAEPDFDPAWLRPSQQ